MTRFLFRIWTGPALVGQLADKLEEAGVEVTYRGTETLLAEHDGAGSEGAAWNLLCNLTRKHGTDFGLRPELVRRVSL